MILAAQMTIPVPWGPLALVLLGAVVGILAYVYFGKGKA